MTQEIKIKKRKLSWKKKCLFSLALLGCFLLFSEVLLRLLGYGTLPPPLSMESAESLMGAPLHPGVCYSMPPHFRGVHAGISVRTNHLGFRDRERTLEKPPHTLRILCVGDSMVFGQAVAQEQVFTALLEKKLGTSFEVWNTGHCAYNTREEYEFLKFRGLSFQPDILLLGFCLVNDTIDCPEAEEMYQRELLHQASYRYRLGTFLSRHSALFHGLNRNFEFYIQIPAQATYLKGLYEGSRWNKTQTYLRKIANLCKTHRIPLYVMIFPVTYIHESKNDFTAYAFHPLHQKIQQELKDFEGVHFIDLLEPLAHYRQKYPRNPLVIPYEGHPHGNYHQLIADLLFSLFSSFPPKSD
jgi:hypothetical protein